MILKIMINPLVILRLLISYLNDFKDELTAIDFKETYPTEGYRHHNWEYYSTVPLKYNEAVLSCHTPADSYTYIVNSQATAILNHFNLTKIWVGVGFNDVLQSLADYDGKPAYQTNIQHSLTEADFAGNTKRTILVLENNALSYKPEPSVNLHPMVCQKKLHFPKRESDLEAISTYRNHILDGIRPLEKFFDKKLIIFKDFLETLPTVKKDLNITFTAVLNPQQFIIQKVLQLQNKLKYCTNKLQDVGKGDELPIALPLTGGSGPARVRGHVKSLL